MNRPHIILRHATLATFAACLLAPVFAGASDPPEAEGIFIEKTRVVAARRVGEFRLESSRYDPKAKFSGVLVPAVGARNIGDCGHVEIVLNKIVLDEIALDPKAQGDAAMSAILRKLAESSARNIRNQCRLKDGANTPDASNDEVQIETIEYSASDWRGE